MFFQAYLKLEVRFFVSLVFFTLIFTTLYASYQNNQDDIYDWKYYELTRNAINSHYYDLSYTQPLDIDDYCPNYKELDRQKRIEFWISFLKELSLVESGDNPQTIYQEKFVDKEGFYVYSIGLFQLSLESANGNYNCNIKDYEELKNPKINIECTINIIDKLIQEDNMIRGYRIIAEEEQWRGLARYWGTLRDRKKINKIRYKLSNMPICKQELDFAFRR